MMMAKLRRHADLSSFPITIFFSLLLCNFIPYSTSSVCFNDANNQTDQFTHHNNLQTLFSKFRSKSASSSFYKSATGQSPNKAYALYLCRGDTTSELCSTCVSSLTEWLRTDGCFEGFAYMDNCMIHYANYSFFGMSNNIAAEFTMGESNATNFEQYNRTLEGVVADLIVEAAYNNTTSFATKEAGVAGSEGEKVYGLAECTPDISKGNCTGCLKAAFSNIQDCCGGTKYAWAMLPSCQLRYDNVSFYWVTAATTANPPPAVSAAFRMELAGWGLFFNLLINSVIVWV